MGATVLGAMLAAVVSGAAGGFLALSAGTKARWAKAIFGLHVGFWVFGFSWGILGIVLSTFR